MSNTVVSSKEVKGVGGNGRKPYVAPTIEIVKANGRPVLYTASPGVGSGYDPNDDIDAKRNDLNVEFRDLWDE